MVAQKRIDNLATPDLFAGAQHTPREFQAARSRLFSKPGAWMYVALIVGCFLSGAALIRANDPRAWLAATLLPLGAIVGYVLTRTVGLPQADGDIGNWMEPLGLASLYVEGALAALSAAVLLPRAAGALRSVVRGDGVLLRF